MREQAITDSMEPALAKKEFEVYLQPKYRIRDHRLSGAEALVRWKHPVWGFQSPGEFIPLFEQNGFITKLDQYVWERAASVLREWDNRGYPPIPVSVNVSRADIYHKDLADMLLGIVRRYRLQPSRLHLEITESAYTENPEQVIETVGYLRELGFVIEMDDFGSGYSSLNMLGKMPVDILKLDMKFIQDESAGPDDGGILHFIMELARWMDLDVVAEGVETRQQLERLKKADCDYVQGYYFARPMPINEFEELLRNGQTAMEQEGMGDEDAREPQPLPVLLVADEDASYRGDVRETFEGSFQVMEASDGKAALRCMADSKSRIAAVILSLTLSGTDGFSVLEVLKREKMAPDIAVIAIGPQDEAMEDRAMELGADDFAGRPHSQRSLRRRVLRAIHGKAPRERAFRPGQILTLGEDKIYEETDDAR